MKTGTSLDSEPPLHLKLNKSNRLLSIGAWLVALVFALIAIFLVWRAQAGDPLLPSIDISAIGRASRRSIESPLSAAVSVISEDDANLPQLLSPEGYARQSINRKTTIHTNIPNRPRQEILDYIVQEGDSVFEIAGKFNIAPETVLWGNYDLLNDNPHLLSLGMELKISPVNGVIYQWQEGDSLEAVAAQFESQPEEILSWAGNDFDLMNPQAEPGEFIIIPGGQREFQQWLIPTIPRGSAGVSKSVYGNGACDGSYDGAFGSGAFIWPTGNHTLSGNDYWSGHLGIDIAAFQGAPIYASDSGVVVFSGWATGGYGNTVMLDHGNGYQTVYAHLSSTAARCGSSVSQGTVIGHAGSTGNSTGTHLHFEVRYQGGFISPWYVLPAP